MPEIFPYSLKQVKNYVPVTLLLILIFINTSALPQVKGSNHVLKTVVIDPGHGGKDPGAICKTGKEKDIVLSVALKLGMLIETNHPEVKVIYTRKTDEFIELYKRAQIANSNKADLFISIHVNSSKKPEPFGSETYVMGLHKTQGNLEVAMLENAVITKEDDFKNQYEGFDPHSPEGFIIFSMYQNVFLEQSLILAAGIQKQFTDRVGRTDRGVKQAGFLVLWKTSMPSVLTELGFLSNAEEAKYLFNDTNQQFFASAIYRAFREYKNEMEGKTTVENFYDEVKIPQDTLPKANDVKKSTDAINDTLIFRVQIMSSIKPLELKPDNFKGLKNVGQIELDGTYKYTIGRTYTFDEIVKVQKDVKNQFPDAFIIAIKNGKKIPVNEAIKQTKN